MAALFKGEERCEFCSTARWAVNRNETAELVARRGAAGATAALQRKGVVFLAPKI